MGIIVLNSRLFLNQLMLKQLRHRKLLLSKTKQSYLTLIKKDLEATSTHLKSKAHIYRMSNKNIYDTRWE